MRHDDTRQDINKPDQRIWCGFEEMLGAGLVMTMTWSAPFFWAPPFWVTALMWPRDK